MLDGEPLYGEAAIEYIQRMIEEAEKLDEERKKLNL